MAKHLEKVTLEKGRVNFPAKSHVTLSQSLKWACTGIEREEKRTGREGQRGLSRWEHLERSIPTLS